MTIFMLCVIMNMKKSIQEFVRLNRLMQLLTAYLREVGLRFFLLPEPSQITKLGEYVKTRNFPVDFVRSHDIFIEMLPKGSSKGAALKEYIKLLNMEKYTVIAAGDYNNDIEMLQFADFGTATANAQQDVKECSDWAR